MRNNYNRSYTPDRFWAKVDKTTEPDGCWNWMGLLNQDGYGKLEYGGKTKTAHRVAWELTNGSIPQGICVCHSCDNPRCCRPDHLWLGTNVENTADRVRKGRGWHSDGELDGMAKLTWQQVDYIREEVAHGRVQRHLAKELHISVANVCLIVNNKTWVR